MNKLSLAFVIAITALSVTLTSCGKKDDNKAATPTPTPAPTTKEMLLGTWRSDHMGIDSNMNNTLDDKEKMPLENGEESTTTFNADGTAVSYFKDNTSSNVDTVKGKWALVNNDKSLMFIEDKDTMYSPIYKITSSELIVEASDNEPGEPKFWLIFAKK